MNIDRFSLIYLYVYNTHTHTHTYVSIIHICVYNHVVCLYLIKCFFKKDDYTIEYKAYNFSKDFIIE